MTNDKMVPFLYLKCILVYFSYIELIFYCYQTSAGNILSLLADTSSTLSWVHFDKPCQNKTVLPNTVNVVHVQEGFICK